MSKWRFITLIVALSMILGACVPTAPAAAPAAPAAPAAAEPAKPAAPAAAEPTKAAEAAAPAKAPVELTVFWHSGGLGDVLVEIAKEYTKETGVVVRGDFVPYGPQWHDKIAADFAAHSSGVDLAVFDSQSMSEFASGGHVYNLNDWLAKSTKLKASDFSEQALKTYAEYPEGSGNIMALPINQDSMGLVYRKDLFEDPKEMAAFKAKYKYELAPPKTYDELRDIAEFFTRPDQNLYGIATYGSKDYDAVSSPFDGVLWSWGGELWDSKTYKAEGVINSDTAVKACEFYTGLFKFSPPGATGWFYDEVNNAVHTGLVAMGINWYYFFRAHVDPKVNEKYFDKMGFAILPGEKGPDGVFRQFQSVGGQGISISKYSKNPEEAWKFLEWFESKDNQTKWVKAGAQTGRIDVQADPFYATSMPFNATFPTAMTHVKDYWHLTEYPQLLDVYQINMNLAVTGSMTCKAALDKTAAAQQIILDKAKPK
jgi:multiple sugar transport system substrate-binding protein